MHAAPPAAPARAPGSDYPTRSATVWAAIAYPIGAVLWTAVAAGVAAVDAETSGFAESLGWFFWAWLWIGVLSFVAAPVGIPLLIFECILWRFLVQHFQYFERDRLAVVQASALLALPWAFAIPWLLRAPIDGPGPALITFFAAGIGLAAARLGMRTLRPGALLTSTQGADDEG